MSLFGLLLASTSPAAAEVTLSFGRTEEGGTKTWRAQRWDVELDYPADWGPGKPTADGGVRFFKKSRGWFELSLIDLPEGEDLTGFSQHLIDKSKEKGWDLRLEKDLGERDIAGKKAHLHKYRHKDKRRIYYGYLFVPQNGTVGIRIMMVKISRKGGERMMDMLRSLRYSDGARTTTGTDGRPKKALPDESERSAAKQRAPAPLSPTSGKYSSKGSVSGHVFLKSSRDKSAYPAYIAFFPLKQTAGPRRSRKREHYEIAGEPSVTATNHKGDYHIDLEPGAYLPEVYNADGDKWPLVRGGKVFLRTKSRRLRHFKIDNR